MCGLFGAVAPKWNPNIVRTLAVCNRERGTDALGFFDSHGRMMKGASDPMKVLAQENVSTWLNDSNKGCEKRGKSWFVAGHTRLGTRGSNCRKNAHPFRYGKIVGSHNGMVDAPKNYAVDSMYLIDSLAKEDGDYNKAWGDISGYWGMTWYDGEAFYIQTYNNTLSMAEHEGVWYYSSDDEHLLAAIGEHTAVYSLGTGETWKFTFVDGEVVCEQVDNFKSNAKKFVKASRYPVTYTGGTYSSNYSSYDDDDYYSSKYGGYPLKGDTSVKDTVKDWDSEWREAWSEYCTHTEHGVPQC